MPKISKAALEGSWPRRLLPDLGILPLQLKHHAPQAAYFPGARVRRRPRTGIRCVPRSQGSTISSDISPIETGRIPLRPIRGSPSNRLVGSGSVTYVLPRAGTARGLGI
jgi:hypothetical protein